MVASRSLSPRTRVVPPLENGDCLDQDTFHARYEAMPDVRAELIGGIVYMSSPMKPGHGSYGARFTHWLGDYQDETEGTEYYGGATSILGPDSELEPDSSLIILPEFGGQTRIDDAGYLRGAPEFVGEIGSATESIDLHAKKRDYEKAGVREYVVIALRQNKIFWFVRRKGKFRELEPGPDAVFRSLVFPGLWLDAAAFLRRDSKKVRAVLRDGLASPEHAAFVRKLRSRQA
jgi:Uma2 family endonuclease